MSDKIKYRLKKFHRCLFLASASAILSAGTLGLGFYEFHSGKEDLGVIAVLASVVGAAATANFVERTVHHKKVYNSIKPIKTSDSNVGVEKTLASESKKVLFFSSKKELKAYRKEKHRREKEEAKQNERTK